MAKKSSLEAELASLAVLAPEPQTQLLAGLHSAHAPVVARAARLITTHELGGWQDELQRAFARLLPGPAKQDPGCQAKMALLEALDHGESQDAEPFLRAVRYVSPDGRDTAGGLRARGVVGLARLGHPDFGLVVAELSLDGDAHTRHASMEALAHRGDPALAGLALLKVRQDDLDPMVTLAAMTSLVALAPAWGFDVLGALLVGPSVPHRELAAVALGQARTEDALGVLLAALDRCVGPAQREPILRGVGLHRSEGALAALLAVIAEGSAADARLAIHALAPRRFEPAACERIRIAALANERGDLGPTFDEVFGRG